MAFSPSEWLCKIPVQSQLTHNSRVWLLYKELGSLEFDWYTKNKLMSLSQFHGLGMDAQTLWLKLRINIWILKNKCQEYEFYSCCASYSTLLWSTCTFYLGHCGWGFEFILSSGKTAQNFKRYEEIWTLSVENVSVILRNYIERETELKNGIQTQENNSNIFSKTSAVTKTFRRLTLYKWKINPRQ